MTGGERPVTGRQATRKLVTHVEGYVREGEQVQDPPIRVAALPVVNNPFVGRYVGDLS